eukprot:Pgem_evm1s16038
MENIGVFIGKLPSKSRRKLQQIRKKNDEYNENNQKSRALPLLERKNLANTLMIAKSQHSMANTFIPTR